VNGRFPVCIAGGCEQLLAAAKQNLQNHAVQGLELFTGGPPEAGDGLDTGAVRQPFDGFPTRSWMRARVRISGERSCAETQEDGQNEKKKSTGAYRPHSCYHVGCAQ